MIFFHDLPDNEKAALIWYHADFVVSRESASAKFNLFPWSGIFIEVEGRGVVNRKDLAPYTHRSIEMNFVRIKEGYEKRIAGG